MIYIWIQAFNLVQKKWLVTFILKIKGSNQGIFLMKKLNIFFISFVNGKTPRD